MSVKGNGGTIKTTHKANVKLHGEVWFDEKSTTKSLALNNVKRNLRVTYDRNI